MDRGEVVDLGHRQPRGGLGRLGAARAARRLRDRCVLRVHRFRRGGRQVDVGRRQELVDARQRVGRGQREPSGRVVRLGASRRRRDRCRGRSIGEAHDGGGDARDDDRSQRWAPPPRNTRDGMHPSVRNPSTLAVTRGASPTPSPSSRRCSRPPPRRPSPWRRPAPLRRARRTPARSRRLGAASA